GRRVQPSLGSRPRRRRLRTRRDRRPCHAAAGRGARPGERLRLARGRHPRARSEKAAALPRAGVGMRDYLERLVARATGEPAIRPRAVARFELGPWHDQVHPVAREDDVAPAAVTPRSPGVDPPRPATSMPAFAARARPVPPALRVHLELPGRPETSAPRAESPAGPPPAPRPEPP